jgi:hypothetical protein
MSPAGTPPPIPSLAQKEDPMPVETSLPTETDVVDRTRRDWLRSTLFVLPIALAGIALAGTALADDDDDDDDDDRRYRRRRRRYRRRRDDDEDD